MHDDETDCIRAVWEKCQELGKTIKIKVPVEQLVRILTRKSDHEDVFWDASLKLWVAIGNAEAPGQLLGYYETEDEAANAVDVHLGVVAQPLESEYDGVDWDSLVKCWRGLIVHEGKIFLLGFYNDHDDCARAVNRKCREIGKPIAKKVPIMDQRKSSYHGVNWYPTQQIWVGIVEDHNKKIMRVGYHDDQEECARQVFAKLGELGKPCGFTVPPKIMRSFDIAKRQHDLAVKQARKRKRDEEILSLAQQRPQKRRIISPVKHNFVFELFMNLIPQI